MDFRLPQPLKYSLKKKKSRRKVLRKETGKLSLKNHNRNASCQTDSSESSEPSSASSSKKNFRSSKSRKSVEQPVLGNAENYSYSIFKHLRPGMNPIDHYCTPARRKENNTNRRETNKSGCNISGGLASEDHYLAVDAAGVIKDGKSSTVMHSKGGDGSHSIILSDSDSDSISVSDVNFPQKINYKDRTKSDNQSDRSDISSIILQSSLTFEGLSSYVAGNESPRGKLTNVVRDDEDSAGKDKPFFRSSVLHKKFNRVVENDLAFACSNSDFYMRVKNRVLGLHKSKISILSEEKSNVKSGLEFSQNSGLTEEDKENVDKNTIESENLPSRPEGVMRRTMIVPDSEDSSIDMCSPNINGIIDSSEKSKSVLIPESSVSTVKDSESKISCGIRQRTSLGYVLAGSQEKSKCVIPDSDGSNEGVSPKRTAVYVTETSDSDSVIELSPDSGDVKEEKQNKETKEKPQSEGSYHSQKTSSVENSDHKSGLFRRVTKRALILDTSDSSEKSATVQEKDCDIRKEVEINLQFKPGFSTLSQSKHEDIKKWLNAIPCHPETDASSIFGVESNSVPNTKGTDDDNGNISLTEMEKVLDQLYGKDWVGGKKSIPKIVPKKKESQIIYERLTDSDDSSTPPLPASTPGKKKLYNHTKNIFTPHQNDCVTPVPGKNMFTPLTSVGKKGRNNTHTTPRTAGPKYKREKECLNSGTFSSPVLTFLSSLSVGHQSARCHPEAKFFVKNFKSKKTDLAQKLFEIFNADVFSSKLPHDLPIFWNNRLRKTAGYCYNRKVKNSEGGFTRTSRVELSSKIIDNAARLRDTLIHELCHAATWIISEVTGGHGPSWKRWTNKAMAAFPELPPISRCHNYDIVTKYRYQCISCNYSIGRHSKSLDIQRKCCGICGGTFELFLNTKDEAGKSVPKTLRTPNAFALFVKENYKTAKRTQDNLKHKDVMKLLSEQFAAAKISSVQQEK
ncbi:germ cell nuclear acidic protein-like [Hetaerina americana]|uniref:germ cell nuclear acidic protein-like n=1 Tax=Hetaerina americana TaxID=62018 RepID=UPI003A7F4A66